MGDDLFCVDDPADEWRQCGIAGRVLQRIEARVRKVADARREPESKQMNEREDVICESGGVGGVLIDAADWSVVW